MTTRLIALACATWIVPSATRADLLTDLIAYYDFNQAGSAGLANKAPGATSYDATRGYWGTAGLTDWATGSDPTGPGFTGKADFTSTNNATGGAGVSDRSDTLIGGALNLDDDRDEYVEIPIGSTQLGITAAGGAFTISAWHALTPGAANTSNRYHVFETSVDYDISWGTQSTSFTTVQPSYPYLAYVGSGGLFANTTLSNTVWQHVVQTVTLNGTQATMKVYVNGQYVATNTVNATDVTFSFPALVLGRARTGINDRDWDGMIDEVAIWTRELGPQDVFELHERGMESIPLTTNLASVNKALVYVSPSDPAGGVAFGSGIYDLNDTAQIDSYPNAGYAFGGWTGSFVGQPESFDYQVTAPASSVVTFSQDTADSDGDGLSNYEEQVTYFTNPNVADSDSDLINDGDEVHSTSTDPNVSQLAAVNYILQHLSSGGTGPNDIVLTRNSGNNTVSFHLKAGSSTTLGSWSDILPSQSGVSMGTSAGKLMLNLPGTAAPARFFRFGGDAP